MSDADVLTRARDLLGADDPLAALRLLAGVRGPDADALRTHITARTAHLASADAYAAFYNEAAPERPWFPEPLLPQLAEAMPRWRLIRNELVAQGARTVLELGCLDGFCLLNLAITHGISSVGVDVNAAAVAETNARAARHGLPVRAVTSLIEDFATPRRFDAVLVLEVLEHVRDVETVLAVAERHCAPGGRIYVSCPLTAPAHQHEREAREHVRLLDAPAVGAILTTPPRTPIWYLQFATPDGMHHAGAYAVGAPA